MENFVFVLIILAGIGAVVALVRGIVIFLRTTEAELNSPEGNVSGLRQNKMMWRRIQFQAIAVVLVVFFLLLTRAG